MLLPAIVGQVGHGRRMRGLKEAGALDYRDCPKCGTANQVSREECLSCGSRLVWDRQDAAREQSEGTHELLLPSVEEGQSDASATSVTKCRDCLQTVSSEAATCPHCGCPDPARQPTPRQPAAQRSPGIALLPHRGTTILVLGILGLCCSGVLGLVALVMANRDLVDMDAGRMDPSGLGLTRAGRILGLIGTVFLVVSASLFVLWLVAAVLLAALPSSLPGQGW
jgi:hypothetical protein